MIWHGVSASRVIVWVLALPIVAGNLWYWNFVVRHGEDRFRRYVERVLGVGIMRGSRGHWSVSSGQSWLRDRGIELLQLGYYLGAFVMWAGGIVVCVALMRFLPDEP